MESFKRTRVFFKKTDFSKKARRFDMMKSVLVAASLSAMAATTGYLETQSLFAGDLNEIYGKALTNESQKEVGATIDWLRKESSRYDVAMSEAISKTKGGKADSTEDSLLKEEASARGSFKARLDLERSAYDEKVKPFEFSGTAEGKSLAAAADEMEKRKAAIRSEIEDFESLESGREPNGKGGYAAMGALSDMRALGVPLRDSAIEKSLRYAGENAFEGSFDYGKQAATFEKENFEKAYEKAKSRSFRGLIICGMWAIFGAWIGWRFVYPVYPKGKSRRGELFFKKET